MPVQVPPDPWARHVPPPEAPDSRPVATPWFGPTVTVAVTAPLGATRKAAPREFAVPLTIRPLNRKFGSHAPVVVKRWATQSPSNRLAACALGAPATVANTVVKMSARVEGLIMGASQCG